MNVLVLIVCKIQDYVLSQVPAAIMFEYLPVHPYLPSATPACALLLEKVTDFFLRSAQHS
eukprot:m.31490 g.31490  ORF g.31490 m.31490 type:complete len:60 (-) comp9760_c0_seq1:160-339(-)